MFESNDKSIQWLKQTFKGNGDHGFYQVTFILGNLSIYLLFQQSHLPEVCDGLLTKKPLEDCWCYKMVCAGRLFTTGTREWNAIWNAIINNSSPYLEVMMLGKNVEATNET